MALLEHFGHGGRVNHHPAQFNGWEEERVTICRALVNDAEVVGADESTSNLPMVREQPVLELLRQASERGRTDVIVTQEPEVTTIARRQLRVLKGRLSPP